MRKLNADKLHQLLTARTGEDLEKGRVSGVVMTVSQCGEIIADLKLGTKNVTTGEPLPPHTLYRLASMTKPVTGVATLIALDRGWFDLNDPVAKYYPAVADMWVGRLEGDKVVPDHKPTTEMKLYQLLTHSNGIMAAGLLEAAQEPLIPRSAYETNAAMVDYCTHHTCLSFDPGLGCGYTGYVSFDMIACIIEQKSGMKYADFVQQNIFDPLGIRDLTFTPTEDQWSRMIQMCDYNDGKTMVPVDMQRYTFEDFPLTFTCAGASLSGTIEDYRIFAEMLRQKGEYNGKRIFSPELIEVMRTPYVAADIPGRDPCDSWGLGVRVAENNPILPKGTFGWSGAYGTHFWVDLENEITAVYMKNNRFYDSHGCGQTGRNFEMDVMAALED